MSKLGHLRECATYFHLLFLVLTSICCPVLIFPTYFQLKFRLISPSYATIYENLYFYCHILAKFSRFRHKHQYSFHISMPHKFYKFLSALNEFCALHILLHFRYSSFIPNLHIKSFVLYIVLLITA